MYNYDEILQARVAHLEREINALKRNLSLAVSHGRQGAYAYPSPYGGGYPQGNPFAVMFEEEDTDTLEMQVGRLLLTACQKGIRYTRVQVRQCKRVVGVIDMLNPEGEFWSDLAKLIVVPGLMMLKTQPATRFREHGIRIKLLGANHFELTFVCGDETVSPDKEQDS